jgi:peroxiredoxin
MKPRILVLPFAAVIIAAMVLWRYHRETDKSQLAPIDESRQLAPRFELYDQHSQLVKFERYLGRTELLVVFFDADPPADEQHLLTRLRDDHPALEQFGLQVVAVSLATPHAVREAERRAGMDFPFPVLTDIDMQTPVPAPVHRLWGLADDASPTVQTGTFYVDRRGTVASHRGRPVPLEDPTAFIDARLAADASQ